MQVSSTSINKQARNRPGRALLAVFLAIVAGAAVLWSVYARANEKVIRFTSTHETLTNPLMGWAPWATIEESRQPHTLVYADLTWREFEPREGFYDFNAFEQKQQLARWRRAGQRVVFRFVADRPGYQAHLDIPDWLYDKIHGKGDVYDNEYGMGFSPDYSNPVFMEYHRKAIAALGQRYGQDTFFAFIELGSLGHWGEWHTQPDLAPLPPESIRDLYLRHYLEAFPQTHLLMRRPFTVAQTYDLGLYNDMTADPVQTETWLSWISGDPDTTQEMDGLTAMPDGWQKAPIGGEQAPALSNEQVYGADVAQTIGLLQRSHTTFIGPNGPYKVEYGSSLQGGLDQVMATIGYRIYIEEVRLPRQVHWGNNIQARLTLSNNGIAPFYYNWPTQIFLLNKDGKPLNTFPLQLDLRDVLPEKFLDVDFDLPLGDLENGTYSLAFAIIDPLTGQPAVQLANENSRSDLIQVLGSFEVKKWLNSH